MEVHKITILYFIVNSLKILNALDNKEAELSIRFVLQNAIIDNNSKYLLK
jgi:hypothetical protein